MTTTRPRFGRPTRAFPAALGLLVPTGAVAFLGYALWWRKNPSDCPYSQRFS